MKAQIHTGYSANTKIYGESQEVLGEFTYVCSNCEYEFFEINLDFKTLKCGKCESKVGYRLTKEWKRPADSHNRKHLRFVMDAGIEFVWTCTCGHDLHHLATDLSHTYCEKCERKTARRINVAATITAGKATWKI